MLKKNKRQKTLREIKLEVGGRSGIFLKKEEQEMDIMEQVRRTEILDCQNVIARKKIGKEMENLERSTCNK